jgi:hypothetical protein
MLGCSLFFMPLHTPRHAQPLMLLFSSSLISFGDTHNTPKTLSLFFITIPTSHTPRIAAFASSHCTSNHAIIVTIEHTSASSSHSPSSAFFFSSISSTLFSAFLSALLYNRTMSLLLPHRLCPLSKLRFRYTYLSYCVLIYRKYFTIHNS